MKVLISPSNLEEAAAVLNGGADIVDIKNPAEGSLGASFPWVIREVAALAAGRPAVLSATLGDLPYKPGTAALAAWGAIQAGAGYIKAGLHGMRTEAEALEVMGAVVRSCRDTARRPIAVAAGYADYRRFGGLDPLSIVRVARDSGASVVMLDTAIKDGTTLFDALTEAEAAIFLAAARRAGLATALAGSLNLGHLRLLGRLQVDIIGVRGAVCQASDRGAKIQTGLVTDFVARARLAAAA